ncbi:DUF3072 domain-containing protein [Bradyrhizobium sp. 83002]|uniref:DUF3072 domain-containing protein n=1 Tax=Bradyrhizobium aeschynomenes TaxID=2734909 RepID=UPI00155739D6|nr:DUF3072 domain-containing protein [Bradyrhizobium aeschynomenes]NPU12887.1 DUF3072 domain-containing protein [Bradyrhizobium aeschynomenes]
MTGKIEKNPRNWTSGDDPMTDAQASYLKTLGERTGRLDPTQDVRTKAQASELIDELRRAAELE